MKCKVIPIVVTLFLLLNLSAYAQLPTASFTTTTPTTGCAPMVVQFLSNSTGSPTSYLWIFGNGGTSTLASPSCTYTTAGSYSVTLIVTNANGSDTTTISNYITAYSAPVVSFSGTPLSGCPPLTVNFTDASNPVVPGAATYLWNFGTGTNATQQNPTYTFLYPGDYNITLSVTNSGNCTTPLFKQAYVHVYQPPVADFSFTPICKAPGTTNFTTTFTTAGTAPYSYSWDFGDGSPLSTATNPSHTYTTAGSYNVTMIVTDAHGCMDTVVKPLSVGTLNANFNTPLNTCPGSLVLFTNTSVAAAYYTWDFGDGSPTSLAASPIHTYTTSGTYNVTLIAKDAANVCADTLVQPITIYQKPTASFTTSPSNPCPAPVAITFNSTSVGAVSYTWDFGDGSPSSNSQNPTHTYNSNGNYTVKLTVTDANGCIDTASVIQHIQDIPLSISTPSNYSHCVPSTIPFSYTISYPPGVASQTWDFGDGSPLDTAQFTSHTYTTGGLFVVHLTVTTTTGCVVDDTLTLAFGTKPTASFVPANDTICLGIGLTLNNFSTNALEFRWYYSAVAIGQNWVVGGYSYPPNSNGLFVPLPNDTLTNITLVADNMGCTDTVSFDSIVGLYPIAGADLGYNCDTPTKVPFFDLTPYPINWRTWDFGDGSPLDSTKNPIHIYAIPGIYNVTLTVHNDTTGCTSSISFPALALATPLQQYVIGDTSICVGDTLHFLQLLPLPPPSGMMLSFSPNQGIVYNSLTQTAVFNASGIFAVSMSYISNGCQYDTAIGTITVANPVINTLAIPPIGCSPLNISILDNGSNTTGITNVQWNWDFGDNTTAQTSTPSTSHIYAPGIYDLGVIVTDTVGCVDTLVRQFYIESHESVAAFVADDTTACINQLITFTNNSTSATNDSLSYTWDFGDGSATTSLNSPTHSYSQPGAYTVKLIATDNIGCADTLIYPGYIKVAQPTAAFTLNDSIAMCPPLIVQFTNNSTGAVAYNWTFGDGSSSLVPNPNNIYTTPGIYTVILIAKNSYGCMDTTSKTVNVLGYAGGLSYTPLLGCNPLTVNFTATLTNVTNFLWDFSDGNVIPATSKTTTHTYTSPGKYLPKMIFTDSAGCVNASNGTDTIFVDDVIADFTSSPACINTPITLLDTSFNFFSNTVAWEWNINNGQMNSKIKNPMITFISSGSYPISLIVTNANGCKDTVQKNLTVYPLPSIYAGIDTSICVGDFAILHASGGNTYQWSPINSLSCPTCATTNASPLATTKYIVEGEDGNGCKNKDTVLVNIQTRTTSIAGNGGEICADSSIQLHISGAEHYIWQPAATLDNPTSPDPIATPDSTTTYIVLAYEGSCAPDTQSVLVVVHPLPIVSAGSDETIIAGNYVTLNASGSGIETYRWTPSNGLSCEICSSPTASPTATVIYTVIATSTFGCTAKDDVTVFVRCDQSQLFIPNTFSPNGDGENDKFYPRGVGLENIRSFRIYNRWGELVYERKNIQLNDEQSGWDGTYKGNTLTPDVYVYVVEGECNGGELMIWKGDITLLK